MHRLSYACWNVVHTAKFVVGTVKDALAEGIYTDSHSVAFIYRTNAQSRALEKECVQENLPYVIFGSDASSYKGQLEIKDRLSFLRWLHNGRDKAAMVRALTTPKRGIGESALRELDDYCSLVESYQKFTARRHDILMDPLGRSDFVGRASATCGPRVSTPPPPPP